MKRIERSIPYWVQSLRSLLLEKFVEVHGKVFRGNKRMLPKYLRYYSSRRPETADENTTNHEHFAFFTGKTRDGVHKNYLLAEAVRLAWTETLIHRFPKKRFRLFVSNEFSVDVEENCLAVDTVLRLWSIDPLTAESFDACYRPEAVSADRVLWTEFLDQGLQPLDEVLNVIQKGRRHPKYERALAKIRRKISD
jgi:hypothetical protein